MFSIRFHIQKEVTGFLNKLKLGSRDKYHLFSGMNIIKVESVTGLCILITRSIPFKILCYPIRIISFFKKIDLPLQAKEGKNADTIL